MLLFIPFLFLLTMPRRRLFAVAAEQRTTVRRSSIKTYDEFVVLTPRQTDYIYITAYI